MIQINDLCDFINQQLNMRLAGNSEYSSDFVFEFYPDSGNYTPPVYENNSNKVKKRVLGIVEVDSSSIVPTSNGLRIATQTLLINFAIKIQKDLGVEDSVREPIKAVSDFMAEAQNFDSGAWFNTDKKYVVSMYGTQPSPGERVQHPQLGDSLTYSFYINFSFVENGVCSKDEELYYNYFAEVDGETEGRSEQIQYISMNIIRSPLSDGSPFSNTDGNSLTWHNGSTLEIHLSLAATTNSQFVKDFYEYLLTGEEKIFEIRYFNRNFTDYLGKTYNMHFSESNLTSRGVENVGLSIKLVQALVEEADAFEEE